MFLAYAPQEGATLAFPRSLGGSSLSGSGDNNDMAVDVDNEDGLVGDQVTARDLLSLAIDSFERAALRGGRDASVLIGLASGDVLLDYVRHLVRSGVSCTAEHEAIFQRCCQQASAAFQGVIGVQGRADEDPPDAKALAWYNLSCLAGP